MAWTRIIFRFCIRPAAFAAAGALISVLVAWSLAWKSDYASGGVKTRYVEPPVPDGWPRWVPKEWPEWSSISNTKLGTIGKRLWVSEGRCLLWCVFVRNTEFVLEENGAAIDTYRALRVETGFPLRALRMELANSNKGPTEATLRSVRAPWFARGIATPVRVFGHDLWRLPIEPIWPAFAVNSLAYGAVLWAGVAGWRTLRSRGIEGRGRCSKCGYSLSGLAPGTPCPECGQGGTA